MLPILRTTENACVRLATSASLSASLGAPVYRGIDNLDKEAPCVICYAESATEDFPFSGIYNVATTVVTKEMAADTNVDTTQVANTIFSRFLDSNTIPSLNSYPSFYVYSMWVTDTKDSWDGDTHKQEYIFNVVCALSGSNI